MLRACSFPFNSTGRGVTSLPRCSQSPGLCGVDLIVIAQDRAKAGHRDRAKGHSKDVTTQLPQDSSDETPGAQDVESSPVSHRFYLTWCPAIIWNVQGQHYQAACLCLKTISVPTPPCCDCKCPLSQFQPEGRSHRVQWDHISTSCPRAKCNISLVQVGVSLHL